VLLISVKTRLEKHGSIDNVVGTLPSPIPNASLENRDNLSRLSSSVNDDKESLSGTVESALAIGESRSRRRGCNYADPDSRLKCRADVRGYPRRVGRLVSSENRGGCLQRHAFQPGRLRGRSVNISAA
jgi:hypothetical protein